ncbi:TetR family transcriptional regulator, partial [Acinetobacter baumannii]
YTTTVRYRTWLINEIYSQLRVLKSDASFTDAKLFLYLIEGAIIQRLSSDEVDERMVEVFLRGDGMRVLLE